jgi:hypothetical protein
VSTKSRSGQRGGTKSEENKTPRILLLAGNQAESLWGAYPVFGGIATLARLSPYFSTPVITTPCIKVRWARKKMIRGTTIVNTAPAIISLT